ncbi:MAG: hypothetical protein PHW73_01090 [Atribacterota bacterium]|nr:hypothetical protein [Atribacterota bacterium]
MAKKKNDITPPDALEFIADLKQNIKKELKKEFLDENIADLNTQVQEGIAILQLAINGHFKNIQEQMDQRTMAMIGNYPCRNELRLEALEKGFESLNKRDKVWSWFNRHGYKLTAIIILGLLCFIFYLELYKH